jgi:hypothetical protein
MGDGHHLISRFCEDELSSYLFLIISNIVLGSIDPLDYLLFGQPVITSDVSMN